MVQKDGYTKEDISLFWHKASSLLSTVMNFVFNMLKAGHCLFLIQDENKHQF